MVYTPPGQSSGGSTLAIILGVILVLCFVGFFVWQPLFGANEEVVVATAPDVFTITLEASSSDDELIPAQYELKNASGVVQEGVLIASNVEVFTTFDNASAFDFSAWHTDYYLASGKCDVHTPCKVVLDRIGYYQHAVILGRDRLSFELVVKTVEGGIQNPLVCLQWPWQVYDVVVVDGVELPVPADSVSRFDKCYQLESLEKDSFKVLKLLVVEEEFGGDYVRVVLKDLCAKRVGSFCADEYQMLYSLS